MTAGRMSFFFFFLAPFPSSLLHCKLSGYTQLSLDRSLQRLQVESEKFGPVLIGLENELRRSIKPSKNDE